MPNRPSSATAAPSEPAAPSLAQLALATFTELRQLIGGSLSLAALEARLAALSLIGIVATALAAVLAIMAFWLTLQATLVAALWRLGVDLLWALAGFTLLNALLVALCLLYMRRLSGNLKFSATAGILRGHSSHATTEAGNTP